MNINKDKIRRDLQTFADEEADVVVESSGDIIFTRGGKDLQLKIVVEESTGHEFVEFEGKRMSYRQFLSNEVARLQLFAKKILEKGNHISSFVNGPGVLRSIGTSMQGESLSLLQKECSEFLPFGTKVTFITADAGHGKTVLLKEFEYLQAAKFINNDASFVFWHVDLQGRDLVRLPEAIMYEVGNLRLQGIYYQSIVTLIRNRLLVLAIDGFDELAAEIGGTKAIGALSSLVSEMDGEGTLIAASRRTFFDTQDYLRRTRFLKGSVANECEFNELSLLNWTKSEATTFIKHYFPDPDRIYQEILDELQGSTFHPILSRPFLLSKVITGLQETGCSSAEFFGRVNKEGEGVKSVVEAFILREVDKWRERDTKTGQPYLTFEQHIELLSMVASDLWENRKDQVSVEEIQFITTILLEKWAIDQELQANIIRMVESHAFLVPVSDSRINVRKFEHEEFRNYFLAKHLASLIEASVDGNKSQLKKTLYIDQLPDSVAKFCFDFLPGLQDDLGRIVALFQEIVQEEWKPTNLQSNIGTLIPFMLNGIVPKAQITIDMALNYSSLIFESKQLSNIEFCRGNFINISIRGTSLNKVTFRKCTFNQIKIDYSQKFEFRDVSMEDCDIRAIVVCKDDEIIESAYSPQRMEQLLSSVGVYLDSEKLTAGRKEKIVDTDFKKLVYRFLTRFNRTVFQYEKNIINERHYGNNSTNIVDEVIPLLTKHMVIEEKETKQSRQMGSRAWTLAKDLETIFKADDNSDKTALGTFWKEVSAHK